ncbi:MAG TPA: SAM-dependent methyltransferase, partial [Myxococcaceae bacterium]|nr:SAM-dependent methyltransferase [Myxococcaceae bacterium]
PPPSPAVAALAEHPWHRREFGSHLTNVIRALVLEARGYSVTVTELTGWEHSVKNELILGRKVRSESQQARRRLDALLSETGVSPALVRALEAA